MSNEALQVLYEGINAYQDPKVREGCLAQFKQERPDFKPQIDVKQFLQHVAYGEQDKAEALLKQDLELAQELLKAHNTPFTDYSGRTFQCTAYEYAYWAKDSHMQRMLEKYIRVEETRRFILERVQAIEERVNPPPAANFLNQQPKPRGLHYTTKDKQGNVIDHWEAHFDLTPLKRALKHYVDEFAQRPELSEADWVILDKIWVEEVGGAQRDVTAHIAQEYCHPDRTFKDIAKNKGLLDASNPANLKRQLKFFNHETGNYDLWFTPDSHASNSGLGFTTGVLRGGAQAPDGRGGVSSAGGGVVAPPAAGVLDLAALTTIDEVRTSELNKSLENLSKPLIVQDISPHPSSRN